MNLVVSAAQDDIGLHIWVAKVVFVRLLIRHVEDSPVTYELYRRQFLVGKRPIAVNAGWKHRDLPDGWVLSYQKDLAISEHRRSDGRTALILGDAYCLDAIETGGCGRYAVLDWPYITTDRAAATLSIFSGHEGEARVVASNAGLAAAVLRGREPGRDAPLDPDDCYELHHPSLAGYVPTPGSRYRGVRRLMRDQRLNIATGVIEHVATPLRLLDSYQRAVDVVAEELTRFAREVRDRTSGRIHLQLTAGLDSRTILAAFRATGIVFETVTFRTPFKPEEDITIARAISRNLGVKHSVIEMQSPPDPAVGRTYFLQTSGGINCVDLKLLFPGNTYRFLEASDVMVGGLGMELGRQKFHEFYEGLDLDRVTGAELWRRLGKEPGPAEFAGFLDEWLAWRRQYPYEISFAASHYLDQRLGAWAATLMSGYDLAPGGTVHPGTGTKILAALLTPDVKSQIEGRLQKDVIRALARGLGRFPYNPVPLRSQIRTLAWRARRAARRFLETLG